MDPATLAHLIINALNQFGPFVGSAAATAIVTDASTDLYNKSKEQARRLIDAMRHRFQREQDNGSAANALQTYVSGDRDFESVVKTKLERILRDDPAFSADQPLRLEIEVGQSLEGHPLMASIILERVREITRTTRVAR